MMIRTITVHVRLVFTGIRKKFRYVPLINRLINNETIKASDTLEYHPTVRPVLHVCAQPYQPGSVSRGQVFRPCIFVLPSTAETDAKRAPLSANSTQHMWELLAGNRRAFFPRHALRRWIGFNWRSVSVNLCNKTIKASDTLEHQPTV